MCPQWAALAMSAVVFLSAVAKPLAPPTTGWLYNDLYGDSYIFPLTATQCAPFEIFYNTTGALFFFDDSTRSDRLFTLNVPKGIGYLEWICNIPAGIAFSAAFSLNYVVLHGSSSACLGNITTTYSHLNYSTTAFESYTRTASFLTTPLPTNTFPTTTFPTGAYSTITLNPNLAVTPSSSSPSSSSPLSSPTTLPSPKSHSASIAGGVLGAIIFVLLILTLVLWWRRRCSVLAKASSPIDPQPVSISGLATGELESMDLSSPFWSSGAKFLRGAQQYQFSPPDPCSHGTEPTSDNPIVVQTGTPAAHAYPIVGQRTAQGITTPLDPESVLPSQRPREPPGNGSQAPFPRSVPDLASRALPTANPQPPPSAQPSDAVTHTAQVTALPDATPLLQPPLMSGTQEDPPDLAAVLGVISRARLSARERRIVASVNNLLTPEPSASPDLTRQNTTASSPPPYPG